MADPFAPLNPEPGAQVWQRLAALERKLRELETSTVAAAIPVVAALPAAGREGRVMKVSGNPSLWLDTGAAWVAV